MAASVEISRPMRKATCPLTPPQLLNHDKLAKKGEPPSSHTRHKPSIFTRQRLELCPLQPVDLLISSLFLIRRQFWFKRYPISERQEDGHPILRGMWEQLLWIRIIFFFFFFFPLRLFAFLSFERRKQRKTDDSDCDYGLCSRTEQFLAGW
ncbi:hypothetical protein BKA81DRAFT_208173 [Phyllosticta paracitricarpa]|uniref:Uncharacterized protein n=1 Tax=Phyllosticta paracitricarpa TaxID=2016321 RepID=A0ABR1NB48_9PEZI